MAATLRPMQRSRSRVRAEGAPKPNLESLAGLSLAPVLLLFVALGLSLTSPMLPSDAWAQNPLLGALGREAPENETADAQDAVPPLQEIDRRLQLARNRLSALEEARQIDGEEAPGPKPTTSSLELATRLVRILEQRREAQVQIDALEVGRTAIESGLARDPSEIVADPPPFPVPTLDGVLVAWRRASEEAEQHERVLEDKRANLELTRERAEDLDKERRRVRDAVERAREDVERIRLETELNGIESRLEIAREQVGLAEQRVRSATIEQELRQSSTRQAKAALTWVESQLAPREADLTAAIDRLDRESLRLDRALVPARSRLTVAENELRKLEASGAGEDDAGFAAALETRRSQLSARQQIMALLSDRIERLASMRTTWQRRYAVLGGALDLDDAPAWRDTTESELERLTRLRRIHEAESAEANRRRDDLLKRMAETEDMTAEERHLLHLESQDLDDLVTAYRTDLASLDAAIELEDRLRVELLARMKNRNLEERLESAWATLGSFWTYELTTSQDSAITPGKIVIALTVFIVGLWLARAARTQLRRRVYPRFGFDAGASSAFASLTFYGLLAVTFLLALRAVNIPLTAFAVAGGALAIGIGFGSQTMLSNFISGLLLLAERPIRTGDLVEVEGVVGTVDSIGLRSTRIQTPDNFHIIVPNASFLESNVVNWTHEDPNIRLRVKVGVAYGSPTERVAELLVQAASEHPRCLAAPGPVAIFSDFGDSALLFDVRFWIRYDERTDRSAIQSDVRFKIDALFAEEGIVIAFPQMDVHLDRDRPEPEDEGPVPVA